MHAAGRITIFVPSGAEVNCGEGIGVGVGLGVGLTVGVGEGVGDGVARPRLGCGVAPGTAVGSGDAVGASVGSGVAQAMAVAYQCSVMPPAISFFVNLPKYVSPYRETSNFKYPPARS